MKTTTCKRCGAPIIWGYHGSKTLRTLNATPLGDITKSATDVFVVSEVKGGLLRGHIYALDLILRLAWEERSYGRSRNPLIDPDAYAYSVHNCR